jgi:hypothetical protein
MGNVSAAGGEVLQQPPLVITPRRPTLHARDEREVHLVPDESLMVAVAVARAAQQEGVAASPPDEHLQDTVAAAMWQPEYRPVRAT